MVLDTESRCPPHNHNSLASTTGTGGGGEGGGTQTQERQKYCYPFREYDPFTTNPTHSTTGGKNRIMMGINQLQQQAVNGSKNNNNGTQKSSCSRRAGSSASHAPLIHENPLYEERPSQFLRNSRYNLYENVLLGNQQNVPPPPQLPLTEPPPLPPKRTTSLFGSIGGGGSTTLTLLRLPKVREGSSLNPKRISIATSSFWTGHPDMAHFASGWELGQNSTRAQSVWGTTERGGRSVTESVDIWGDPPAVKKGILLQQRDKLWSRWKERYFILTRDYLNCFRRTTSVHRSGVRLSEMGSFIYKLRLADVDSIEWETRKSGSIIALILPQEPKILLRVPGENYEALHQWFTLLQECVFMSKERRRALRSQHGSMLRSIQSYNPNASNKSTGSASPNSSSTKSSSKSASNSDIDRLGFSGSGSGASSVDGEKSFIKHSSSSKLRPSNNGLFSLRKLSEGSGSGSSSIMGTTAIAGTGPPPLRASYSRGRGQMQTTASGKYSPLIDDEDEDYDDADVPPPIIPPPPPVGVPRANAGTSGKPQNQGRLVSSSSNSNLTSNVNNNNIDGGEEEFKVTLRRRREFFNNGNGCMVGMPTSWKRLSLAQPLSNNINSHHEKTDQSHIFNNFNLNRATGTNANGNGYSVPVDAKPIRPDSWTPQQFHRTSSLVPSQWTNRRDILHNDNNNPNPNINDKRYEFGNGSSRSHFNGSNNRPSFMYCPSRVTNDVSFRKMSEH